MPIKCPNPDCRETTTVQLQDPETTDNFQYKCLSCGLTWQPYRMSLDELRYWELKKHKRVV